MRRFVAALLFLTCGTEAYAANYSQRFGMRFLGGVSGYTALASKSYGFVFPLTLEGTYGITNSLEVFVGFKGILSVPLKTQTPYPLPYSASFGMRYYYNVDEPVKAYTAIGTNIGLDRFGVEIFPSTWGLQWDVSDNIALCADGGLGLMFGNHPMRRDRWETSIRVGFQIGAQYHF